MTIHKKILLLLLISVSLYTVLGVAFQRGLILPSFLALEAEEAHKNMQRCLDALDREFHHLNVFCFDWSAWDDTYAYIEDPTEAYETSNLSPASFVDNHVNLMYFFDTDGRVVWGAFYDLDTAQSVEFVDIPEEGWAATHRLLNPGKRDDSIHGILHSSRGPLLLVSRPILPSEASDGEQSRGTMLMGRLLSEKMLDGIRAQAHVDLAVYRFDNANAPIEAKTVAPGEKPILYDSTDSIRVLSTVVDLEGEPALSFVVTMPRSILARGRAAIRLQTIAAVAAGLLFTLLLSVSMRHLVSHPLRLLGEQARAVRIGNHLVHTPSLRRNDEIGRLAKDFKNMLRRLHNEEAERDTAEVALRNSEARLETILRTAPDAIVVTNSKGCIESANDAASRLFGYSSTELVGTRGRDLLAVEERDYWVDVVASHGQTTEGVPFTANRESAIRDRDGVIHPVHMCVSSVVLEGSVHFISAVRDISGVKALQASVARARHLATIGEMGASVAHDIRNPLAGMKGVIQLLREGKLDESDHIEALDGLSESADRIAHIVDQLLRFARPLTPHRGDFTVRPLLEAVVDSVPEDWPEKIAVTISCPAALRLNADSNLFRQVLENVWLNAIQAAGPSGQYAWTARTTDDGFRIELDDDGPGISDDIQGQIFEPFFTSRVNGTGLGLSISLRIMEAHHGSIQVEDRVPMGTRVTITLPGGPL